MIEKIKSFLETNKAIILSNFFTSITLLIIASIITSFLPNINSLLIGCIIGLLFPLTKRYIFDKINY